MVLNITDLLQQFFATPAILVWRLTPTSVYTFEILLSGGSQTFSSTGRLRASCSFQSLGYLFLPMWSLFSPSLCRSLRTHRAQKITAFSSSQCQPRFVQLNSLFPLCIELHKYTTTFYFLSEMWCIFQFHSKNIMSSFCKAQKSKRVNFKLVTDSVRRQLLIFCVRIN